MLFPRELYKHIISYLPLEALLRFSLVSKDFKSLCDSSRYYYESYNLNKSAWEQIGYQWGVYSIPKPIKPEELHTKKKMSKPQLEKFRNRIDKYEEDLLMYQKQVTLVQLNLIFSVGKIQRRATHQSF